MNDENFNNWLKWTEENIYKNVDIKSIKHILQNNTFTNESIDYMINMANYNIENRKNKINYWILSVKSDLYNNVNKIMELNKFPQWESFLNNFYGFLSGHFLIKLLVN